MLLLMMIFKRHRSSIVVRLILCCTHRLQCQRPTRKMNRDIDFETTASNACQKPKPISEENNKEKKVKKVRQRI